MKSRATLKRTWNCCCSEINAISRIIDRLKRKRCPHTPRRRTWISMRLQRRHPMRLNRRSLLFRSDSWRRRTRKWLKRRRNLLRRLPRNREQVDHHHLLLRRRRRVRISNLRHRTMSDQLLHLIRAARWIRRMASNKDKVSLFKRTKHSQLETQKLKRN